MTYARSSRKMEEDETTIMVSLKSDMKYFSKQLDKIDKLIEKIDNNYEKVIPKIVKNEENIQTLFSKYKELNERINKNG